MIKQKITLILGAGTSYPYGFPLGTKLMDNVIKDLQEENGARSHEFTELLKGMGFDYKLQQKFAKELDGSKLPSIDAFLQERGTEFQALGKTAIAAALIPYERPDNVMLMDSRLSSKEQGRRWYHYLLDMLGRSKDFPDNNLSIITFNYDRSIEYFFFNTIKYRFGLNEQEAIRLLKTIPIVHFYGQLGKFDFLDPNGRAYSPEVNPTSVKKCVNEIHLMYEERDELDSTFSYQAAYDVIKETQSLIFLGFGYHEPNLERLKLREYFTGGEIVASFCGKKDGEKARDRERLLLYTSHRLKPKLYDGTVLGFLQDTDYLK